MNRTVQLSLLLGLLLVSLNSCELIGGIFKAGVWTGIFIVAVILALILFIISKMNGKE